MFASSSRRLVFMLIVVGLAFPIHASAAPLNFGGLLAKATKFFSALWAPVEGETDGGRRSASDSGKKNSDSGKKKEAPLSEVGCEIMPGGLCNT